MRKVKSVSALMLFFAVITILFVSVGVASAQEGDQGGLDWLRNNKLAVRSDEVVVEGTIFTIVPASKRLVVKSGNPEKTLVLGFMDDVEVGDGKAKLSVDTLQRGNDVVIILRKSSYARAIYRKM